MLVCWPSGKQEKEWRAVKSFSWYQNVGSWVTRLIHKNYPNNFFLKRLTKWISRLDMIILLQLHLSTTPSILQDIYWTVTVSIKPNLKWFYLQLPLSYSAWLTHMTWQHHLPLNSNCCYYLLFHGSMSYFTRL